MRVIQVIQSTDPFKTGVVEAPKEVVFYNGQSLALAISAMSMAAADYDQANRDLYYRILSVRLEIQEPEN